MMDEREPNPLSDEQLDELLQSWRAPAAPSAELHRAIFGAPAPAPEPWWRRLWSWQLRLPAPAFAMLLLMMIFMGWRWSAAERRAPQVVIEHNTEVRTVEVASNNPSAEASVKPAVCRRRPAQPRADNSGAFGGMRPESELKARVIQGGYEQN